MELERPRCGSFLPIQHPALRMVQQGHAVSGNGWRERLLLKRSALRFAARNSAPAGCATMFLSERFELDVENQGGVLAAGLDAMIRVITAPAPPPVIASRKPPRHRSAA
jgi:hypothetical protein